MRYLTVAEVLYIHEKSIRVFGGETGILSTGALENCVELPKMKIYGEEPSDTLWMKAAHILHCIVTRHPFLDGNKRTGWVAAKIFLKLNGYSLNPDVDETENMVREIAEGNLDVEYVSTWIFERVQKR